VSEIILPKNSIDGNLKFCSINFILLLAEGLVA